MPIHDSRTSRRPTCAAVFLLSFSLLCAAPAAHARSSPFARPALEPGAGFTVDSRDPGPLDLLAQATDDSLATDSLATPAEPVAPPETPPPPPPDRDHDGKKDDLALRGHGRPNPIKAVVDNAKNFVSDALYLVTAPIRMDAKNVAWVAGVSAVGVGLYQYDGDVFDGAVRSVDDPVFHGVVQEAGGFFEPLGLISKTHWYWSGASVVGWVFDVPLLRTIPGEILESNSIVGPLRQPIEKSVGRRRPSESRDPRDFSGGRSFPSGHASVICETAAILSHHATYPAARILIWGVAGLVCVERIDPEKPLNHWPSDIWMGAALGTWAGHTIAVRNEERRRGIPQRKWYDVVHRPPKADWSVMPYRSSEGVPGLAVRASF